MNKLQELFSIQQQLDQRIVLQHGLEHKDLFENKCLALLVELGELANETRCFKHWSTKGPSSMSVILEEYVDGLHFILSLGNDKNYNHSTIQLSCSYLDLVHQFNHLYQLITSFTINPSLEQYAMMFGEFLGLGQLLGFDEKSIYNAYMDKNKENHLRQERGY